VIVGGFFNPAHVPTTIGIEWTQNVDVLGSVVGPFPADSTTPVPIVQGATSIDVFGGNGAAAGDTDVPFFAIFYLNI
jgi:NADPH-dependent 2,4-dienoyl-CoA reductase/sulfur reductase-like enzyme